MSDSREQIEASLVEPVHDIEEDPLAVARAVAHKIIETRKSKGMTQVELAHACGMKPTNLCRIETAKSNPSLATLSKIARGLGCKLDVSFK